jgi:hypothetical protein
MKMMDIYRGMLVGDSHVFQLAMHGKAKKYALGNIAVLGVCFGLSNLLGALQTTPDLPLSDKFAIITPLLFSVAGIVIMCGALIGFTMIYWAAARAFGGQGGLGLILDLIGLAAIPFWILAPLLNYTIRYPPDGPGRYILIIAIIGSFLWSFELLRRSLMTTQGLGTTKATIAVTAMWIFSISSVYVFLP